MRVYFIFWRFADIGVVQSVSDEVAILSLMMFFSLHSLKDGVLAIYTRDEFFYLLSLWLVVTPLEIRKLGVALSRKTRRRPLMTLFCAHVRELRC